MAGQALGPFAGFVLMGANMVAYSVAPPVLALGAATYRAVVWPGARCFIPFHLLLMLNGAGVAASYLSLCAAVIVARMSGASEPVVGLLALAGVIAADWSDPDVGRPSLVASLAVIAVFAAYCGLRRRAGGLKWALAGPGLAPDLTASARNLEAPES